MQQELLPQVKELSRPASKRLTIQCLACRVQGLRPWSPRTLTRRVVLISIRWTPFAPGICGRPMGTSTAALIVVVIVLTCFTAPAHIYYAGRAGGPNKY